MADPELDAQVQKYERKLEPRPRAEIEAELEQVRTVWVPKVERYNELVRRRFEIEEELLPLRSEVFGFERASGDLDWEYFRRLQLDGFIPTMPRVTPDALFNRWHDLRVGQPTDNNHKNDNEGDEDGDDPSSDFEVGEEGQENRGDERAPRRPGRADS